MASAVSEEASTHPTSKTLTRAQRVSIAPALAKKYGISTFMLECFCEAKAPPVKAVLVHDKERLTSFSILDKKKETAVEREKAFESVARQSLGLAMGLKETKKLSLEDDKRRLAMLMVNLVVLGQVGDPVQKRYELGVTIADKEKGEDVEDPKYFRPLSVKAQQDCILASVFVNFLDYKEHTATRDGLANIGSLQLEDPEDPDRTINTVYYAPRVIADAIFNHFVKTARKDGILDELLEQAAAKPPPPPQPLATVKSEPVGNKKAKALPPPPLSSVPAGAPRSVAEMSVASKKQQQAAVGKEARLIAVERNRGVAFTSLQLHASKRDTIVPDALEYVPTREDQLHMSFFPVGFDLDAARTESDVTDFMTPDACVDSRNIVSALLIVWQSVDFAMDKWITWMRKSGVSLQTGNVAQVESLARSEETGGRQTAIEMVVDISAVATATAALSGMAPQLRQSLVPLRDFINAADKLVCFRATTYAGNANEPRLCSLTRMVFKPGDKVYSLIALARGQYYTTYVMRGISFHSMPPEPTYAQEESAPKKSKAKFKFTNSGSVPPPPATAEAAVAPAAPVPAPVLADKDLDDFDFTAVDAALQAFRPPAAAAAAAESAPAQPPPSTPLLLSPETMEPFWAKLPEPWKFPNSMFKNTLMLIDGNPLLRALCAEAHRRGPDVYDDIVREFLSTVETPNPTVFGPVVKALGTKLPVPDPDWWSTMLAVMAQFVGEAPADLAASKRAPPFETDLLQPKDSVQNYRAVKPFLILMHSMIKQNAATLEGKFPPITSPFPDSFSPVSLAVARVLFLPLVRRQ